MANVYYTKTFDVSPGTRVGSQTIEDQFLLVEQAFDSVQTLTPRLAVANTFTALQTFGAGVAIDTGTYTGVNNFTGGSITVSTQAPGTNTTAAASTAFVTAAVLVETNRATTAENLLAPKASPTFTGTVVLPSTTSIGSVTNTEISYLGGVTSAIQTQLNAKAPINNPTFTGTVTVPTPVNGTDAATKAYADAATINNGVNRTIYDYTATGGQTTFTVTYTPGYIDVYVNGVKLQNADFTASNGTSVVLGTACTADDAVTIVVFATISLTQMNIAGGAANDIPYQLGPNSTSFISPGTSGYVLTSNGPGSAPSYSALPAQTNYLINSNTTQLAQAQALALCF